jgi:hypothetical protein
MGLMGEYSTMKEFNEMRRNEDRQYQDWERSVKVKRCACGSPYSYGYEPVLEDPGACQNCRGAEGEIAAIY